jgi:hypothetical protein
MASKANLVIDQGTTYSVIINLDDENGDPLNIGGYSSRAQMRKHYTSSNAVSFATSLANGELTLSLSANQTSAIIAGRYVYDAELIDSAGNVTRIVEGIVTVTPEVSR